MKKTLLAACGAVIVAGGAWYGLSPALAMQSLKDAALAGDKDELQERVDFPAVRESLKSQIRVMMMAEMQKQKDSNPFAALGMAFAGAIVDPMIDGMISPSGIKAIVENGKLDASQDNAAPKKGADTEVEWDIERRGLDKFIAKPVAKGDEKAPALVFRRDGLGWDLVDVEVPVMPGQQGRGV